jgi:hypothetical protein
VFKKTRAPEFPDGGVLADPDQLIGVVAGELDEWAWFTAELADWFERTDQTTRVDLVAATGQLPWPPAGTSHDRPRACPDVP